MDDKSMFKSLATDVVDYTPYTLAIDVMRLMGSSERERTASEFYRNQILPFFQENK